MTRSERRLSLIPLLIAFILGIASATQIAMIGAMSRQRGIPEATWVSMLATIADDGRGTIWRAAAR